MRTKLTVGAGGAGLLAAAAITAGLQLASASDPGVPTTTPIKHVVVIYDENISFDHYFGTYPNATNPAGEPAFTAAPGTPAVDGLTPALLTSNPNGANPVRLDPKDVNQLVTCDNNHGYTAEQNAFDGGLMDKFPSSTACDGTGEVMRYYDGNSVTALWNYAQRYAMSDDFFGTGFGPSTIGAIELVSGNTTGAEDDSGNPLPPGSSVDNDTIYSNAFPYPDFDGCTSGAGGYVMSAATSGVNQHKNVGDLLNAKGVSWGWFQGGFTPTSRQPVSGSFPHGQPVCASAHNNVAGASQIDYDAHHNPFAYYRSTANPEHLAPTSIADVGTAADTQGNHQYDLSTFDAALAAGNLPSVSFLKAPKYQDGHAGNSDPIDEQHFLVSKINEIEASPDWASTAIIVTYDDSDGWYDHKAPAIVRKSVSPEDTYDGAGSCGSAVVSAVVGTDRCGFGPRLPLVVISPYAKVNFVDHTQTDQTSVLKFIEDNWSLGAIGGNSLDTQAGSLSNLFDFSAGATPAAAMQLQQDGEPVPAATTTTTTTTTTAAPPPVSTTTPATTTKPVEAPPVIKKVVLGTLTAKGKLSGKTLTVTLRVKTKPKVKTSLRVRLLKGKKQLGTKSAVITSTSVKIVLKLKKRPAHGKYTLSVAVAQPGASESRTLSVKL